MCRLVGIDPGIYIEGVEGSLRARQVLTQSFDLDAFLSFLLISVFEIWTDGTHGGQFRCLRFGSDAEPMQKGRFENISRILVNILKNEKEGTS